MSGAVIGNVDHAGSVYDLQARPSAIPVPMLRPMNRHMQKSGTDGESRTR